LICQRFCAAVPRPRRRNWTAVATDATHATMMIPVSLPPVRDAISAIAAGSTPPASQACCGRRLTSPLSAPAGPKTNCPWWRGRRGEFGFRVGRREIGHLHGDHAAHFSFPKLAGSF
jgi:hypothetical protein